jgi:hypothetical protein
MTNPPRDLVVAYMKTVPNRPGLIPLVAEPYPDCGETFSGTWKVSYPLIWEDELEGYEYGIAGTGFLALYRRRLFLVTAKHCLREGPCNNLRVACNPKTKTFLPLQALHRASTPAEDSDFADLAIFEAKPGLLTSEEQRGLHFLDMRQLALGWRLLEVGDRLTTPGFPKGITYVDFDNAKLVEQRYVPSGLYEGPTDDAHIHRIRFPELNQVESIDGMSGSPALFVKNFPEAHYYGCAGMLIRGGTDALLGRFIELPVIVHALNKICEVPLPGPR